MLNHTVVKSVNGKGWNPVCFAHTLRALCVLIMFPILGMQGLEVTGLGTWLNGK